VVHEAQRVEGSGYHIHRESEWMHGVHAVGRVGGTVAIVAAQGATVVAGNVMAIDWLAQ
jgi:hypothetical protein